MKNNNAKLQVVYVVTYNNADNNKNINIVPIISYNNALKYKSLIYSDNNNKSGIYRWNNIITGKSYVGSSINLTSRLSIYIIEYCEKDLLIEKEQYYLDILKQNIKLK